MPKGTESARLHRPPAGFDVGTRATIDVDFAIHYSQQSRVQPQLHQSVITLKTATGSLTNEDLQMITSWLVE
jgi:hypothetical protein